MTKENLIWAIAALLIIARYTWLRFLSSADWIWLVYICIIGGGFGVIIHTADIILNECGQ